MATEGVAVSRRLGRGQEAGERASLREFMSVFKIGITAANLLATVAGLWVGSHGRPDPRIVFCTLLGTALVVASGAALNNFLDRDIDTQMERTKHRLLAAGRTSPRIVLWSGVAAGAVGITVLAMLVNVVAAACAFAGLLLYSYVYTVWLKRTTTLSTVLGGLAGAMPPLVGFAAGSGGQLDMGAFTLFSIFFLWQPPHFLPLAMKRSEEYRAAGIPMLPVVRGYRETKWQILRYTAAMVPMSLLLYGLRYEGPLYLYVAAVLGLIFLVKAFSGLYARDDLAWARSLFGYSLVYLTVLCITLVISAA